MKRQLDTKEVIHLIEKRIETCVGIADESFKTGDHITEMEWRKRAALFESILKDIKEIAR